MELAAVTGILESTSKRVFRFRPGPASPTPGPKGTARPSYPRLFPTFFEPWVQPGDPWYSPDQAAVSAGARGDVGEGRRLPGRRFRPPLWDRKWNGQSLTRDAVPFRRIFSVCGGRSSHPCPDFLRSPALRGPHRPCLRRTKLGAAPSAFRSTSSPFLHPRRGFHPEPRNPWSPYNPQAQTEANGEGGGGQPGRHRTEQPAFPGTLRRALNFPRPAMPPSNPTKAVAAPCQRRKRMFFPELFSWFTLVLSRGCPMLAGPGETTA